MNKNNPFEIDSRYFSLEKLILSKDFSENSELENFNYEDFLTPFVLKEVYKKDSIITFVLLKEKYKIIKIGNDTGLLKNKMLIEPNFNGFPGAGTNNMEFRLDEKSISGIVGGISFSLIRFREIYTQFLRVEFDRDYYCKIIGICNDVKGDKGKQNMDKKYLQVPKVNIQDRSSGGVAEELLKNAKEKIFGKDEKIDEKIGLSKRLSEAINAQWKPKMVKETLDSNDFLESHSKSSQKSVVAYYPLNDYKFKNVDIFYEKMRPVAEQKLLKQLIKISKHYFPKEIFEKEMPQ